MLLGGRDRRGEVFLVQEGTEGGVGLTPDRRIGVIGRGIGRLEAPWLGVVRGRVKERTATRYEQLLRCHVWPVIGDVRRRKLPPGDVQRVIDRVRSTRSARTSLHVYRVRLDT